MLWNTKPTTDDDAAPTAALEERPELWVPEHLADDFATVAAERREFITPLSHANWFASMTGQDVVTLSGRPGGLLRDYLADAIAAIHFNGVRPGSVPRPSTRRSVVVPVALSPAERSKFLGQWEDLPPTEEDRQQLREYQWSEEHVEEYRELIEQTVQDVLSEHSRIWEAFVHITLVHLAVDRFAKRTKAEQQARAARKTLECPICRDMTGSIAVRPLSLGIAVQSVRNHYADTLRSCPRCWDDAVQAYREQFRTTESGQDRAQLVRSYLAERFA